MLSKQVKGATTYKAVINEICGLSWASLSEEDMICAAWAYYFFSIQFRENLEVACDLYPEDGNLARLRREECATKNLSPFPQVAAAGEAIDHDEFMRRALELSPISQHQRAKFYQVGDHYLREIHAVDPIVRALSISSYEDSGLEQVFTAILKAPLFENPALNAFRFFLSEHIRFDSDPDQGHGSLSRHLVPDESVYECWAAFLNLLTDLAPALACDGVTAFVPLSPV